MTRSRGFVKLPLDRATAWDSLPFYDRAVGSELFRAYQEREIAIGLDWQQALARHFAIDGRDRPSFYRALERMMQGGVLSASCDTLQLLYTEETFRSHRAVNRQSSSSERTVNEQSTDSDRAVIEQSSSSELELSGGNDSRETSLDRKKDREIDRKKDTPRVVSSEESLSSPSEQDQIAALEARYPSPLPREVRDACALSRKIGRMTDACWRKVLARLDAYSLAACVYAMREFTEKHADGSKREEYLVAIAKRAHENPNATTTQRANKIMSAVSATHTAEENFEWTAKPN